MRADAPHGPVVTLLHGVAGRGRTCLVLGLVTGLAFPGLAAGLRPWLPELVALTLFVTALRVGPAAAFGGVSALPRTLGFVGLLQVALPLAALSALTLAGLATTPLGLAVLLAVSAPSIAGAPNFAIMTGHDPAPAMRLFVLGTALFPLTVLPVLWLAPGLAGAEALAASVRLILVILLSTGLGFGLRYALADRLGSGEVRALDGAAALLLSVLVVGLMAGVSPALRSTPVVVFAWLCAAVALNFGLQLLALWAGRRLALPEAVPVSIIAGNRNIALFLIALPAAVTDPLLIFVGCYQIPMYLTPLVMKPLHDRYTPR